MRLDCWGQLANAAGPLPAFAFGARSVAMNARSRTRGPAGEPLVSSLSGRMNQVLTKY